jgi:hypothetical protein
MSLNHIERNIIEHMAKTMFAAARAEYHEEVLGRPLTAAEVAMIPDTPDYVLEAAAYQAGRLSQANGKSLFFLFRDALAADEVTVDDWQNDEQVQREFGYGMIMPMMGHGTSWFDNHTRFPLVKPDFEWSYFDLDAEAFPIPEDAE